MDPLPVRMQVRLLEDDEEPDPHELDIGANCKTYFMTLDDVTLVYTPPLLQAVEEYVAKYGPPKHVAIVDIEAEPTSALARAIGIKVPRDLCAAAMLSSRLGVEVLKGTKYENILLAYYGLMNTVLEEDGNRKAALAASVGFWSETIHDPEALEALCEFQKLAMWLSVQGFEDLGMLGGVCAITATGYAYPAGFSNAETVVHFTVNEDGSCSNISVGTIAEDVSFMYDVHHALYEYEMKTLEWLGIEPEAGNSWTLMGGDYIRQPELMSVIPIEEIVPIVAMYAPNLAINEQ